MHNDRTFSNLSMQVLSKSNHTIFLDFTQIENLTSNINSLFRSRVDYLNELKMREKEEIVEILNEKKFVEQKPFSELIEDDIVDSIENNELIQFPIEISHLSFP